MNGHRQSTIYGIDCPVQLTCATYEKTKKTIEKGKKEKRTEKGTARNNRGGIGQSTGRQRAAVNSSHCFVAWQMTSRECNPMAEDEPMDQKRASLRYRFAIHSVSLGMTLLANRTLAFRAVYDRHYAP